MNKKQFIALADHIRIANSVGNEPLFNKAAIDCLADFCRSQNPAFKEKRWLSYINGECGPNGGKVK